MATHTFVDFERPEAFELCRLTSIEYDLRSTLDLCKFLAAQFESAPNGWPPSEITDAFSTAILIRYSRAFVTGRRHGLHEGELAILNVEELEDHNRLRFLRDKHVAHSVNAFEDSRVQARYCLERVEQEGITSVSVSHYRVFGLSGQDIEKTKHLCGRFLKQVEAAIETEKSKLLPVIRALPLQEVLGASASPLIAPAIARVDRPRARP